MSTSPQKTIERLPEVIARTGLARSSIYAAIAAGGFPKPIKLSARAVGFLSSEIDEWIAGRAAARAHTTGPGLA
ncbi:MAG TPA: AlpA family transcriptional regulator [Caulobacteraceae bacterium]|jgi:prophage regulatory protein